jgi:hypothetical protein
VTKYPRKETQKKKDLSCLKIPAVSSWQGGSSEVEKHRSWQPGSKEGEFRKRTGQIQLPRTYRSSNRYLETAFT